MIAVIIDVAYFHLTHDDWLLAGPTCPHKCVITGVPGLMRATFASSSAHANEALFLKNIIMRTKISLTKQHAGDDEESTGCHGVKPLGFTSNIPFRALISGGANVFSFS